MISNSSSTVCSVFDSYPYVIVAAVSSGSAMVSALCCIFVIVIIFLLKKHYFFIQRLIVYHCLTALLRSFSTILRLHRLGYQNDTPAINTLCIISGFTNQVTAWCLIMDYYIITFTLLMTAVFHKNVSRLEGLYIVLIFIFPLTFNWIPFIDNSYGRYGAWCWIRDRNYDNCTQHSLGIILQNALQNVPQYILLVVLIPTYLIVIAVVARQRCRVRGKESHDHETAALRERLNEEVWPLLFFPFGVFLLNVFPLINGIYESVIVDEPSYVLWILTAISAPLQGGYIALVYTLDRQTVQRLAHSNLKVALLKRKGEIHEYPSRMIETTDMDSNDLPYHSMN